MGDRTVLPTMGGAGTGSRRTICGGDASFAATEQYGPGHGAAYNALADPARADGPVTLAYCWSHVRRRFYETLRAAATPRSLRRPSCASPHSLGSSARSVAMCPSSAAPCAWPKPGRSSMICALGSRRNSPRSHIQAAPALGGSQGAGDEWPEPTESQTIEICRGSFGELDSIALVIPGTSSAPCSSVP